jgi:cytochrome b
MTRGDPETPSAGGRIRVWDALIRVFHWALVAAFTVAFLSEDAIGLHVWAGYIVGCLVLLRVIWGFVGTKYARFSDFACGPRAAAAYVRDLLTFRASRHLGHSPGGGLMVIVLLLSLAATVGTGLVTYAEERQAGPLSGLFASSSADVETTAQFRSQNRTGEGRRGRSREGGDRGEAMEELHEFFANFTLALAIVHVCGVLWASLVHRENLILSMFTGFKRR